MKKCKSFLCVSRRQNCKTAFSDLQNREKETEAKHHPRKNHPRRQRPRQTGDKPGWCGDRPLRRAPRQTEHPRPVRGRRQPTAPAGAILGWVGWTDMRRPGLWADGRPTGLPRRPWYNLSAAAGGGGGRSGGVSCPLYSVSLFCGRPRLSGRPRNASDTPSLGR